MAKKVKLKRNQSCTRRSAGAGPMNVDRCRATNPDTESHFTLLGSNHEIMSTSFSGAFK